MAMTERLKSNVGSIPNYDMMNNGILGNLYLSGPRNAQAIYTKPHEDIWVVIAVLHRMYPETKE